MLVRVKRQCDANIGGQRKALFPDQLYELPQDEAVRLVKVGSIEEVRVRGKAKGE